MFDHCHRSRLYGPQSVLALARIEWWGGDYDVCLHAGHISCCTDTEQKFYANPLDVTGLDAFVFNVLAASAQERTANTKNIVVAREAHGIETLPVELLNVICSFLPASSVIKLHRTSKTMAIKVQLDNAFWRDSLRTGCLHAHIWDVDTRKIETLRQESNIIFSTADWDWRSVARLLATKKVPLSGRDPRLDDMPPGLWNRCRIWATIERALQFEHLEKEKQEGIHSSIEIRRSTIAGERPNK